jgi:hypothetical protein
MSKCIVQGCEQHSDLPGDWLCARCFVMLHTGIVGQGATFIHRLHDDLLLYAAAQGLDGDDDLPRTRARGNRKT